jgi:hypothetical protein
MQDSHGGKVKHVKVLERVYEPRRLRTAWRQVKQNAGAAGIDQMTVEAFERREVRFVMDLKWFRKQGMIFLHDFTNFFTQPL